MFLRAGSKSSRNFSTGIFPDRKSCARFSDCSSDSAAAVCRSAWVVSGDMPADFVSDELKTDAITNNFTNLSNEDYYLFVCDK